MEKKYIIIPIIAVLSLVAVGSCFVLQEDTPTDASVTYSAASIGEYPTGPVPIGTVPVGTTFTITPGWGQDDPDLYWVATPSSGTVQLGQNHIWVDGYFDGDAVESNEGYIIGINVNVTVTFATNNSSYGNVYNSSNQIVSSISVPSGSSATVSGNTITINGQTYTAKHSTNTAQYSYSFSSWSNASGSISSDRTITANFTRTTNNYTVSVGVSPTGYGSVNNTSVTVPYGTAVSTSGNTITIGSTVITATPTTATAQYTYSFSSWTGKTSGTVTGNDSVTANFTRTTNNYTISIGRTPYGYGSVDNTSVTVPYGTTVSTSGNTLTIGSNVITATPTTATAQYTYSFVNWTGKTSGTVTGNDSVTANFSRALANHTVTFVVGNAGYGSVDHSTVIVPYGTRIYSWDNTVVIGSNAPQSYSAYNIFLGAPGDTIASLPVGTSYTINSGWGEDQYAGVYFTATPSSGTVQLGQNQINISGTDGLNGPEVEENTAYIVGLDITPTTVTATPTTATAQYTYSFQSWTGVPNSMSISGDITITANFNRTVNNYTVTISPNQSGWGTVSNGSITVPYGTSYSVASNVLTVGSTQSTATASSNTVQYTYGFSGWSVSTGTVIGNMNITANFIRTVNQYTVTISPTPAGYGSVNTSSVMVDYGSAISTISNVLSIGSTTVTATPTTATAQYTYSFSSWSSNATGQVTGDMTITASFVRSVNNYTVTISVYPTGYGSVSTSSVTVPYGASISSNGNILTIGTTQVTATSSPATAQYVYTFDDWTNDTGTVTANRTITANFLRYDTLVGTATPNTIYLYAGGPIPNSVNESISLTHNSFGTGIYSWSMVDNGNTGLTVDTNGNIGGTAGGVTVNPVSVTVRITGTVNGFTQTDDVIFSVVIVAQLLFISNPLVDSTISN